MSKAFGSRAGALTAAAACARRGAVSRLIAAVVGAVLVASFAMTGSALATTGHGYFDQFGGVGGDDGQFTGGPSGVAVLQGSGDVLASDPGHMLVDGVTPDPRIERFDAGGTFVSAFSLDGVAYSSPGALAVDPAGAGSVYVSVVENSSGAGAVLKFSAAGVFAYALDASASGTSLGYGAVAVDPVNGTVYVGAADSLTGAPVVDMFDQAGVFVGSFDGASGSPDGGLVCGAGGLAVDGSHSVYVMDPCKNNRVDRYSSAGVFDATVDDGSRGGPVAMTVDPVSGELFVAESGTNGLQVTGFTGGVTLNQTFSATQVGGLAALAVGHSSDTIYTADGANSVIERFTAFAGPTVTTDAAAPVSGDSATLNGTVDPGGVAATYRFEWGTTTAYGTSTAISSAGSGSTPVAASAALTGLSPNSTYHYRIVATNVSGSITGPDQSFSTASVPPVVDGAAFASAISPTSARIHATINPNNSPTSFYVDYGTTTAYGLQAGGGDAGSGGVAGPVVMQLSDLLPGTVYHFRVVADDGTGGLQMGNDQTLITAPAAPAAATGVSATKATLQGTINPHGTGTTYHFDYGPSASYGQSTPEVDGGSGNGDQAVARLVSGLSPASTYYVRVVATTNGVIRTGAEGRFRTAPAPVATAMYASGVSTSAATLTGTVNTFGVVGRYRFEVASLNSLYSTSTDERLIAGAPDAQQVAVPVAGLPAGETFRVRLVITSNDTTAYSDLITFATAPTPPVVPVSPRSDPGTVFGCAAPHLNAYDKKPKPGETITITGSDLGVGATVALGDQSLTPTDWSTTGFTIQMPEDATGTLPLTVNCGHVSNTVAVAMFHEPANAFSITRRSVAGSVATLSLKVPGPGKLETSSSRTKTTKTTVTKAATITVKVRLTTTAVKALRKAKSRTLKVAVVVRFTPAGGQSAAKAVTLTFRRQAGR